LTAASMMEACSGVGVWAIGFFLGDGEGVAEYVQNVFEGSDSGVDSAAPTMHSANVVAGEPGEIGERVALSVGLVEGELNQRA